MELLFINNVIVNWLYIERRQKRQKEDRKDRKKTEKDRTFHSILFRYYI